MHDGVFADGEDVHLKLTMVVQRGADGARHRYVLTGSDNDTTTSLDRPEVLLRVNDPRKRNWRRYTRFVDGLVRRAGSSKGTDRRAE